MIVATSFVPVHDPEAGAAFESAMRARSHAVESFPGFRRFEFQRALGRSPGYVLVTWWDTKEDLRRYLASPEHRATHGRLTDAVRAGLGPPSVDVREVLEGFPA